MSVYKRWSNLMSINILETLAQKHLLFFLSLKLKKPMVTLSTMITFGESDLDETSRTAEAEEIWEPNLCVL